MKLHSCVQRSDIETSNILNAQSVNLRGEKQGDFINLKNGKFTFDLKVFAPASFILK